jgi:hypothetical protein
MEDYCFKRSLARFFSSIDKAHLEQQIATSNTVLLGAATGHYTKGFPSSVTATKTTILLTSTASINIRV